MDVARVGRAIRHYALTGAATGVAYYGGSLLGLSLRPGTAVTSILWPPNALLTAALLVTPRRRWPAVLLGALTAHVIAQARTGWSPLLVLALFATNSLEALIGALLLRRLSDAPTRFDTLRRFGAFIVAPVIAAPLLSTFADAAVVTLFGSDAYWQVWRSRLPANVLAQLTVTPAVVAVLTSMPAWFRQASPSRRLEGAALALCLIVSGTLAFGVPLARGTNLSLSIDTPLVVQLPFVLWAALRFGPGAVSMALLSMTCLAAWSVVSGHGAAAPVDPERIILTIQLFLISAATTLLVVAVLIEERRLSMHAVSERLRFERLLFEFTRAFAQVPSDKMDAVSREWLARLGSFLSVDCVRLFQVLPNGGTIEVVCEWRHPSFAVTPPIVFARDFPWIVGEVISRRPVVLHRADALPPGADQDRASLRLHGYNALLVVPMLATERVVGALSLGTVTERAWSDEVVANLLIMCEVLANALARRQMDETLRASEVMKSGILDSLSSGVAVIDKEGRLLDANANWNRLAPASHFLREGELHIGDNLLGHAPPEVAEGLTGVLRNTTPRFVLESASTSTAVTRWWRLVATRLNRMEGGAVVTLTEVTDRRRAEIEAVQSRQALAHVGRVSTIGELTASLAHQLSQPLTGILSNAQATRRLLDRMPPDFTELREATSDIVDDARRAGEVVQKLRELLRRGELKMTPIDVSAVLRDIVHLVTSDAIIRRITLALEIDEHPLMVLGDRVQLQQVLLNLIVNALEAIDEHAEQRIVRAYCQRTIEQRIRIMVSDSGAGLPVGAEDLVFDPFYTTKPEGMGMGLSIAKSIVETHGGTIRARNVQGSGAVVEFWLPSADSVAMA